MGVYRDGIDCLDNNRHIAGSPGNVNPESLGKSAATTFCIALTNARLWQHHLNRMVVSTWTLPTGWLSRLYAFQPGANYFISKDSMANVSKSLSLFASKLSKNFVDKHQFAHSALRENL